MGEMILEKITDRKINKWCAAIIYLISIILILSYIGILYLAKNPSVCIEYKLYYIDKTLNDWPGYGGLSYKLGDNVNFGMDSDKDASQKRKGAGWIDLGENGLWTNEYESILFFDLGNINQDIKLNLSVGTVLTNEVHTNSDVGIYANGNLVSEFKPEGDHYNFECVIPGEYIADGLIELKFSNSNPISVVDEQNQYSYGLLGFRLDSIRMEGI